MHNWMKSGDGLLKRAKSAITKAMPASRSMVDNTKDPASAHSRVVRATAAKTAPSKTEVRSFRKQ